MYDRKTSIAKTRDTARDTFSYGQFPASSIKDALDRAHRPLVTTADITVSYLPFSSTTYGLLPVWLLNQQLSEFWFRQAATLSD